MSYEIRELITLIRNADPVKEDQFQHVLSVSKDVLQLTDADLAREFQLSRTTIGRWRTGENSSLPIMRKFIFEWLEKQATLKIQALEKVEK